MHIPSPTERSGEKMTFHFLYASSVLIVGRSTTRILWNSTVSGHTSFQPENYLIRVNKVPVGSIKFRPKWNLVEYHNKIKRFLWGKLWYRTIWLDDWIHAYERERESVRVPKQGAKCGVRNINHTIWFRCFFHFICRDLNYYYYSLSSLLCYWTMISYHSFKLQTILEQKRANTEEKRLLLHIGSDNNNGRFNEKWASNNNCIFIVWNT